MRLLTLLLVAVSCAAEEIPLSEVWAWDMPGTKDIQELAKGDGCRQSLDLFRKALRDSSGKELPRAFAVQGAGSVALRNAASVLSGERERPRFLQPGEVTAVFYSTLFGAKVAIESVEETDSGAKVQYRFLHDIDAHQTDHFALIPLSPSKEGEYTVDIETLPISEAESVAGYKDVSESTANRIVGKSFVVMIVEEKETPHLRAKE